MPIRDPDRTHVSMLAAWQRAYAIREIRPVSRAWPWPADTGNRGGSDVLAAWGRWHVSMLDESFSVAEWPWYAVLERARVETLASEHLVGMALNLENFDGLAPARESATVLYRLARASLARDAEFSSSSFGATHSIDANCFVNENTAIDAKGSAGIDLASIVVVLTAARSLVRDASAFAEHLRPLVHRLAQSDPLDLTPHSLSPSTRPGAAQQGGGDDEGKSAQSATSVQPPAEQVEDRKTDAAYAVYSRRWDQVAAARYWREAGAESPSLGDRGRSQRRLANRLQRRLQAARLRRWNFDQDEGLLDSRRLARLLIPAADPAVFRRESETSVPEACVVLLVDQSSSMRGAPRQIALLAVDLAARALELCQVQCEVLGYTTRFGADNPLTREWATAGKPPAPGRLNAVRHIIYKSAQQPWRRARRHLGLMLAAEFGRENIDGEALIWAASRLRVRPEPNKVLVVLSDGVPYDAATVSANGRLFLQDHLRAAIARIESGPMHLAAIGAGQNVGRYYRNALTLRDAREVAPVLLAHLGDVLTRVKDPGRSRRMPH